jgi:hypothetical protein
MMWRGGGQSLNSVSDTSPEADRILTEIYRKMSISDKWRRLGGIYRSARILHATGVRLRNPAATPSEIHDDWIVLTLGESMLKTFKEAVGGFRG